MAEETERFLEAEKRAEELVDTLNKLHQEIQSYQSATDLLNSVREKLVGFINASQDIVKDSHEVILLLKSIGGPEIIEKINGVSNEVVQGSSKSIKLSNMLADKVTNESNKLKVLLFVTISLSSLSLIIGILALLK